MNKKKVKTFENFHRNIFGTLQPKLYKPKIMQEDISKPNYAAQNKLIALAKGIRILTKRLNYEFSMIKSKNSTKTPATSYKTFTFIQKILMQAEQKPEQVSEDNLLDILKEEAETLASLQELEFSLEKLQMDLNDMIQNIRYDLYSKSREIQETLKARKQLN